SNNKDLDERTSKLTNEEFFYDEKYLKEKNNLIKLISEIKEDDLKKFSKKGVKDNYTKIEIVSYLNNKFSIQYSNVMSADSILNNIYSWYLDLLLGNKPIL